MFLSKLLEEASSFRGWKHHEHHPSPRHQNDTTYTMLSVTIDTVMHNLMWYTYWNTCFEPSASTKRAYCDYSLLKSWPPGALEKSSITDQISVLTPWSISLRQNCLSIAKAVESMGAWKSLHLIMKTHSSIPHLGVQLALLEVIGERSFYLFPKNFWNLGSITAWEGDSGEG